MVDGVDKIDMTTFVSRFALWFGLVLLATTGTAAPGIARPINPRSVPAIDGTRVYSANLSDGRTVHLAPGSTPMRWKFEAGDDSVGGGYELTVSRNAKYFIASGFDGLPSALCRIRPFKILRPFPFDSPALSPSGSFVAYQNAGRIVVREVATWRIKFVRSAADQATSYETLFSSDGLRLYMLSLGTGKRRQLAIESVDTRAWQTISVRHTVISGGAGDINVIALDPQFRSMFVEDEHGAYLYDLPSGAVRHRFRSTFDVFSANYSLDGKEIAVSRTDGADYEHAKLVLIRARDGAVEMTLPGDSGYDFSWSSSGRFLASTGWDTGYGDLLTVWDLRSRTQYHVPAGMCESILQAAITPDGRRVIVVNDDEKGDGYGCEIWRLVSPQ